MLYCHDKDAWVCCDCYVPQDQLPINARITNLMAQLLDEIAKNESLSAQLAEYKQQAEELRSSYDIISGQLSAALKEKDRAEKVLKEIEKIGNHSIGFNLAAKQCAELVRKWREENV